MSIHVYKEKLFDSREEVWMAMWLEELKEAGYVERWNRITLPVTLFDAVRFPYEKVTQLKTKEKREWRMFTLLQDLEYTPDFYVSWTDKGFAKFVSVIGDYINPKSWFFAYANNPKSGYIEVKPVFDQNDKTAKFSIIQKIIWNTQRIFVDLIIPEKLFEATFMPTEAMPEFKYKKSPTGKNKGKKGPGDWKTDYNPKSLKEFLKDGTTI